LPLGNPVTAGRTRFAGRNDERSKPAHRSALDNGARYYGTVSENDPALVALRASQEPVDLHLVDTALAGEFAYPMSCRGRLVERWC